MKIYNCFGSVDLLFWLQRVSYSININRLRPGMVCTVTVARNGARYLIAGAHHIGLER